MWTIPQDMESTTTSYTVIMQVLYVQYMILYVALSTL